MKTIGFRAENGAVNWAVVEGSLEQPVLVEHDRFTPPRTYSVAQAAIWLYSRVCEIVDRHKPSVASIRYAETFLARKPSKSHQEGSLARARFEGIILVAAASKGLEVCVGQLQQIKSRLGSKDAKAYIESGELRGVDLTGISENRCEAILAATSALGDQTCKG